MNMTSISEDWTHAKYMPALNEELKIIVAVPFKFGEFERLGILQARARHLGW